MAGKALPSQGVLHQLLSYDPETGKLFWKERGPRQYPNNNPERSAKLAERWNRQFAGKEAGVKSRTGYMQVTVLCELYLLHRVIWKLVAGEEPDHIDGTRANNRWVNLRSVVSVENHRNKCIPSTNTSGTIGVRFDERRRKWVASITVYGRTVFLGRYEAFSEAVAARKVAEREHGFHKNHGRAA